MNFCLLFPDCLNFGFSRGIAKSFYLSTGIWYFLCSFNQWGYFLPSYDLRNLEGYGWNTGLFILMSQNFFQSHICITKFFPHFRGTFYDFCVLDLLSVLPSHFFLFTKIALFTMPRIGLLGTDFQAISEAQVAYFRYWILIAFFLLIGWFSFCSSRRIVDKLSISEIALYVCKLAKNWEGLLGLLSQHSYRQAREEPSHLVFYFWFSWPLLFWEFCSLVVGLVTKIMALSKSQLNRANFEDFILIRQDEPSWNSLYL